ncbi:unnamed protein product [Closterium sp. NIES-53]
MRVPLPPLPASSLAEGPDPETDLVCAASPTVPRLLATVVTDPSFDSGAASALVAELVDFATASHLDYAAILEDFDCLAGALPHLVAMLLAPEGDPDAPDIPTSRSYMEVITVPSPLANIVNGVWIFSVKRPPSSPPVFKARYVARGFCHTTFLQGNLHEEIRLRRPPGFTWSFPLGTQWSLRWPVYGLHQAPRERHDALRTTLATLGFAPLTADPSLFLRTDTSLPPFYILVYVDDLVFATAGTKALALVKSELQKRHTCTDLGPSALRLPVLLATVHSSAYKSLSAPPSDESIEASGTILARYVAPGRHQPEHWEAAKRVLRYLCSSLGMGLVLGGRGPVVLTGHADAS